MSDIFSCVCCRCNRIIPLGAVVVYEGRDYHDSCYLKGIRTRIAQLDEKAQRGTITLIDSKELGDLRFLEGVCRKDIESRIDFNVFNPDNPVFLGNTPLGKFSQMNPPAWKKLKSLEGTKYHCSKTPQIESDKVPILEIITDEKGHKYCLQTGVKLKPALPLELTESNSKNDGKNNTNMPALLDGVGLPQKKDECEDMKLRESKTDTRWG